MKKIFFAAALIIGVVASQFVGMSQAQAEMVSVPGTKYYIFPETLKYDSHPTHLGKSIKNAYDFSIEATNANYKFPNGPYIHVIYHFHRISDKTWLFRTSDEKLMPPAVYNSQNAHFNLDRNFAEGVVYKIFLAAIEYLPEAEAAQLKADLAQQPVKNKQSSSSSSGSTGSSSASIGNLPDAAKLAELKQAAEPFVTQADAKFKAKDYTAAKELFSQAIEKNPYDYHSHDLYARALYREKSKEKNYDLILSEANKALELATDNKAKADCCGFIAKVYRKLTMNNLFNSDKSNEYLRLGQKYLDMENQFRQQT